jgi:hypothetical protein
VCISEDKSQSHQEKEKERKEGRKEKRKKERKEGRKKGRKEMKIVDVDGFFISMTSQNQIFKWNSLLIKCLRHYKILKLVVITITKVEFK